MLMGRRQAPTPDAVNADEMHHFLDEKVASVRASTSDAPSPSFTVYLQGHVLCVFRPLTVIDFVATDRALPDKQCMSHPHATGSTRGQRRLAGAVPR
jgi:hypothetical protein